VSEDRNERTLRLASEPLVAAGPVSGFVGGTADSVRGVWRYRELLDLLVRRELKARYKDSALGFLWSLIRPLTQLLIYYIAIGKFLGAERSIPDYAVYIFTGLTAWTLFSEIISTGTGSIVANGGLVKKIYLPREVFPLSVIGSAIFNFVIQFLILVAAALLSGYPPTLAGYGYVLLGTAVLLVYATAAAFLLSAVNVYLRDVQYLVEVVLMVGFWLSPIVYAWSFVNVALQSEFLNALYLANPVTLAVLAYQRGIWVAGSGLPQPTDLGFRLVIVLLVGLPVLWICQRVFARLQNNFAQEL
jgi:ABC-2 type transport system permease protein